MQRRRGSATSRVLLLLCLMYLLAYVNRVGIGTAAGAIKGELMLSHTQLGLVFSGFGYPYAIFQIAGGLFGDRWGPRWTLGIAGVVWAGATALTGLATGLGTLFTAQVLLGLGQGAAFPTATRAMQAWTEPSRRGFVQGLTHAFARAGNALTPPLMAFLMVAVGWRGAFGALGTLGLIWVLVWTAYFRDDPRAHPAVTEAELRALPAPVAPHSRRSPPVPWRALIRRILPVTLTYFCYAWTFWMYLNWLPSFFQEGRHLDLKQTAGFAAAVFVAGVLGDALGGVVSDRLLRRTGSLLIARRTVVLVGLVGAMIALAVVPALRGLGAVTACLASGLFFLELVVGPMWAIPMDVAPELSGTASGLMNVGAAVAAILSPLAFGAVVDATGSWTLPFWGSVGLLAVGCGLALRMRPDVPLTTAPRAPYAAPGVG